MVGNSGNCGKNQCLRNSTKAEKNEANDKFRAFSTHFSNSHVCNKNKLCEKTRDFRKVKFECERKLCFTLNKR